MEAEQKGSLVWNALYQQRPTARGRGLIKSEWFGEYKDLPKLTYRAIKFNNISDASLKQKGIVKLSSSTNSTSETEAATPLAVKNVNDNANNANNRITTVNMCDL